MFYHSLIIIICGCSNVFGIGFDGLESKSQPQSQIEVDPALAKANVTPQMRGLTWSRPEISLNGILHAYSKHLGPTGKDKPPLFQFNDGTKAAKQATINLVEGILNDPIDIQKGMGLDGNRYSGYLGEFEGKIIEIRIAEQNSTPGKNGISKIKAGELSTVVRLNENNLNKHWSHIKVKNGTIVRTTQSSPKTRILDEVSLRKPRASVQAIRNRLPNRIVNGVKGASAIRAADLIPGREAVKQVYQGEPEEAVKTHLVESAQGLPVAAGTGLAITAMPTLARVAGPVGGALVIVQTGETLDEVVTQQTGENSVSKFRQAIGTRERTGISSPDYMAPDPNAELVIPTITQASPEAIAESERRRNRNAWQKRWDCVKERFNPSKLEFGISELFRGCHN